MPPRRPHTCHCAYCSCAAASYCCAYCWPYCCCWAAAWYAAGPAPPPATAAAAPVSTRNASLPSATASPGRRLTMPLRSSVPGTMSSSSESAALRAPPPTSRRRPPPGAACLGAGSRSCRLSPRLLRCRFLAGACTGRAAGEGHREASRVPNSCSPGCSSGMLWRQAAGEAPLVPLPRMPATVPLQGRTSSSSAPLASAGS